MDRADLRRARPLRASWLRPSCAPLSRRLARGHCTAPAPATATASTPPLPRPPPLPRTLPRPPLRPLPQPARRSRSSTFSSMFVRKPEKRFLRWRALQPFKSRADCALPRQIFSCHGRLGMQWL